MATIVHVDMDAFFCACETKVHPEYTGKPLIVGGYRDSRRSVVSSCSYEARQFGVKSAMPIAQAARLCPQGVFVPPNMALYRHVSRQIHDVFQQLAPIVEPISIDEAFLDMTGCEHIYPDLETMGHTIKQRVFAAVGCTASAGIASCKFLAKLASALSKPDGLLIIRPEDVDRILLPLPVERLWGVGEKTAARLRAMGIKTVAHLRSLDRAWLERQLGKAGGQLYELARGQDDRPVEPPGPAKSLGNEITLARDLRPGPALYAALHNLAAEVARRLQLDERYGRTVTLKVRYRDFTTLTRRSSLPRGLHTAPDLEAVARRLLRSLPQTQPIRLIGIYVSDLSKHQQLELFSDPRTLTVEQLMAKLNAQKHLPRVTTAAVLAEQMPSPPPTDIVENE